MYNEEEVFFQCPYCFEQISFVLETEYGEQSYIEDCEVCCRPIEITYSLENEGIKILRLERANG